MQTDTRAFAEFLRLDLTPENRAVLAHVLTTHFGAQPDIKPLLDLVLNGDLAAIYAIHPQGHDRLFLSALVSLVQSAPLQKGGASLPAPKRIRSVDEAYDFFHTIRDERNWSLIRCMNFLYRTKCRATKKTAIVTSIRNEGINIIEWIAHHRLMGVDDFIIYANDNDDGSSDLLNLLAQYGIIHIIWNRTALGKDGGNMFPIQAKVFAHAGEILPETMDFDWLMFTDMDEFLVTPESFNTPLIQRPLDDLLARIAQMPGPPAAILCNWKWFTSYCEFQRKPGLNFERFQHYVESPLVKTIVRNGHCLDFGSSHRPRFPDGEMFLDGKLQAYDNQSFVPGISYDHCQINHYWNKSFEEFVAKNLRVRGDVKFPHFFSYGNNRQRGTHEAVPDAWIARLHAEIAMLSALPGIAAAVAKIEQNFTAMLAAFDQEHGIRTLFDKYS